MNNIKIHDKMSHDCFQTYALRFIDRLLVLILIFQYELQLYFSLIKYYDEIIAFVIFAMAAIVAIKNRKAQREDIVFLIVLGIFSACGWISSLLYHYRSFAITASGFYVSVKWFMLFWGVKVLKSTEKYKNILDISSGDFWRVVATLYTIYFLAVKFNVINVGIVSFVATIKMMFFIAVLWGTSSKKYTRKELYNTALIIVMLASLFSSYDTAKVKFFVPLVVLIAIVIIIFEYKINLVGIFIAGVLAVVLAWKDIYKYFFYGYARGTRSILLLYGIKIANEYFPFATGWGAFGSYFSGVDEEGSAVYALYGLDRVVDMQWHYYYSDMYWGNILGETGWIGTACVLMFIVWVFFKIQKLHKVSVCKYAGALLVLAYMIVATVEGSAFSQPLLMCMSLFLATYISDVDSVNWRLHIPFLDKIFHRRYSGRT